MERIEAKLEECKLDAPIEKFKKELETDENSFRRK